MNAQPPPAYPPAPGMQWAPYAPPAGSRLGTRAIVAIVVLAVVAAAAVGALAAVLLQGGDGTTPPEPLAVDTGAGQGVSPSPSPSATAASPGASPSAGADDTRLGSGLTVPLPPGWGFHSRTDDGTSVTIDDGVGDWAVVKEAEYDAGTTCNALAAAALKDWVTENDGYSRVRSSEPSAERLPDTDVDVAAVAYVALFTDDQGSARRVGIIYAAVKPDGSALFVSLGTKPKALELREEDLTAITAGVLAQFAGVEPADTQVVLAGD